MNLTKSHLTKIFTVMALCFLAPFWCLNTSASNLENQPAMLAPSPYCDTQVYHLGIPAETASSIFLTITNVDASTMEVSIESANADAVDLLIIAGGSGATVSAEDTTVPGVISRTLSWGTAPTDVILNVLWSKVSFGGNWQLNGGDITVQFADDCTPLPSNVTLDDLTVDGSTVADFDSQDVTYDVELASGTTVVPTVAGIATDVTSTVVVNDAASLPGSTTVVVTAMDSSTETYTINFTVLDDPLVSNYCLEQVYHLGIPAEIPSSIIISIASTSPNSMVVEIESADADPVDYLQVNAGGVTISDEDTSVPGKIRRTMTWAGTAPADVALNVLWSKVSFGGNWQLSGGDIVVSTSGACPNIAQDPLLLTVDVSCTAIPNPTSVRMTGPFWGWDPNAGPIAADNGDGTWTVTLDPRPTADMEYLWIVDGNQENLVPAMVAGGSCAPVTDFATYANRLWTVGSNDVTDNVYDQCDACPLPAVSLTVDVSCSANPTPTSVRMTGPFWAWDPNGGPIATDNGDGTWTVTLDPQPGADMEYLWILDGVQENLVPAMQGGGTCAPITDFANYANRLWTQGSPDVTDNTYGQCNACGAMPLTLTVDMSCTNTPNPTEVRMTGAFWGWDPAGGPVAADNGDGTWTVTLDPAPTADMEYLWVVDGTQEDLIPAMVAGGTCAPVTDFATYANRQWSLGSPSVTGDVYGQCDACGPQPLTLTVDVSCTAIPNPSSVRMTGPFWGWDPNAGPIASDNGDGTWTVTLDPAPTADMEYLWIVDGNQEDLVPAMVAGGSCAPVTDFANYANRLWTLGDPDVTDNVYNQCDACPLPALTLTVDFSCTATPNPTEVRMTGAFWGWDPAGGPIAADNGDGTWTVTLDPAPTADMEYLWIADMAQEDLIQAMIDGGTCAPVTDFANYANRQWTVGSPNVTGDVYGQCDSCGDIEGCTDASADNYDPAATIDNGTCGYFVTFQVDMNEYVPAFGFVNVSGTWNAFCADCNQLTDDDMDGVWTGTFAIPNGEHQFKYQVDSWNDQETLAQESCTITIGGFTNRSLSVDNASQTLDVSCWASCFACANGGTLGCTDATANNYDAAATANDGSCLYDVTFSVDMNLYGATFTDVHLNGTFNGFCGDCAPMDDSDMDGIYTLTVEIADGYYEYKYTTDNFTTQETLAEIVGCTVNNFGFINRYVQVSGDATLDTVCWEDCAACNIVTVPGCTDSNAANYDAAANQDNGSCLYSIDLAVDMNQYTGGAFTTVYVSGEFNSWNGAANPLADGDLDGVWVGTVLMPAGDNQYKFTIDDWADQEFFVGGETCTITDGGFTNRLLNVSGPASVSVVCFESCMACSNAQWNVTFRVDMSQQTIDANGVHIAGSFQGWDPAATQMTAIGYDIYEYTIALTQGSTVEFLYINGNDFAFQETVPMACGTDNGIGGFNRSHTVGAADETISVVCFSECEACSGCTDPLSVEFDPFAGSDDGSCMTPIVFGCTYADAENYDPAATTDDTSCTFAPSNPCPADLNEDGVVNAGDLLAFLGEFGTTCAP